jgi:hypothetical protein
MKISTYSRNLSFLYGNLIAGSLIVYFFLMYALGLIHVIELHLFNFLIQVGGIYLALRQFKKMHHDHLNFLRGISIGLTTSLVATGLFAIFLFLYLTMDHHLMEIISERGPLGIYLNPYVVAFTIVSEGFVSGLLATFLLINGIGTDQDHIK